jgi:hypothetical protein
MKSAFASVVGVTALLSGCASSEAFVSRAVRKSQAYAEVMARSSHTTFVIEEKHPDYAIVALGEMTEAELKRIYTLRVNWTGSVWRKVPDIHVGSAWLPEH